MNSNISLALASKLDKIMSTKYGPDSRKFLSFIPADRPFRFSYEDLILTTNSENDIPINTVTDNKYYFSLIANYIPQDKVVFEEIDNTLLYDQFSSIINNSITANKILTPEDEILLRKERTYLEENFANYQNFKNLLNQALENYANAKITLDCVSTEEKAVLQTQWDSILEKKLLEEINNARINLSVIGKQLEVESSLATINKITTEGGINFLRKEIIENLEKLYEETSGRLPYYTTLFSPFNIFMKDFEWSKISMLNSEIKSLCETAKPELINAFPENETGNNVESISFEYATVSIVRPWFNEDFFASNSFKLNDLIQPVINDGKIPANGIIPCYINKFICIREVEYKLKNNVSGNKELVIPMISDKPIINFKINKLSQAEKVKSISKIRFKEQEETLPREIKVVDHRNKEKTIALNRKILQWNSKHIARGINPKKAETLNLSKDGKASPENLVTEKLEGICIIAFECKRLPLSPNPNNMLNWD